MLTDEASDNIAKVHACPICWQTTTAPTRLAYPVTESMSQEQVIFDKAKCGNCLHMDRHLNSVTKKFVIGNVSLHQTMTLWMMLS